jgi:hypothetical protein
MLPILLQLLQLPDAVRKLCCCRTCAPLMLPVLLLLLQRPDAVRNLCCCRTCAP